MKKDLGLICDKDYKEQWAITMKINKKSVTFETCDTNVEYRKIRDIKITCRTIEELQSIIYELVESRNDEETIASFKEDFELFLQENEGMK